MNQPPNRITVDMKEEDVEKNLVEIVKSMDCIRNECLKNLESNPKTDLDYLRFSAELASCIKPQLSGINAESHISRIRQCVDRDPLLLRYDNIQNSFWERRQPKFKDVLDRMAIILLKDNFCSTSQTYHVFQGIKYLFASAKNQEVVYDTILPFNSLLSELGLKDPIVASFVMQHLFQGSLQQSQNGMVLSNKSFNDPELVGRLKELGALYVDLPQGSYSEIKAKFPNAIVLEENGVKLTRVILRDKSDDIAQINLFNLLSGYAAEEISAEGNIKPGIKTRYGFGKQFVQEMEEKIGIKQKSLAKKKEIIQY